jgi:tRNA-Thr(GGU) m(6)t(6)A37 methyltransferase TsaA
MASTDHGSEDRFELRPIGHVRGGRADVEDDGWRSVTARIELDGDVLDPDATAGLEAFSHIEVVFVFDRVDPVAVCTGARHPRGREDWPRVGILAQRAKDRPNRLGVTVCELRSVEEGALVVAGLDAVDGTPVLDVKPFMSGFAPAGPVREPAWAGELMRGYW